MGKKELDHKPQILALLLSLFMCDLVQTTFPLWAIVSLSTKFWTRTRASVFAASWQNSAKGFFFF